MPFRINSNNPLSPTGPVSPATRTAETPAPASTLPAQDGLQLSKSADTISRLAESDAANRAAKVSKLAAAGKSGSYKVESAAVSKAIVAQALAAGQRGL
jgi:anti-sigma28 factor (negative regulator of flagellin synthesis)